MKRLWILMLAVLLLAGCTAQPPQTQPSETTMPTETTVPTEPLPSFYIENSPMERGTGGVVRQYELEGNVTGLAMFDGKLLLCTDNQKLWLLDNETLEVLRSRELEQQIFWDDASLLINEQGIAWYDAGSKTYMTLDANLSVAPAFALEEDLIASPVISRTMDRIYYATDSGLEVMIPADGTSRRLREEYGTILSVDGLLFEGEILSYTRQTDSGEIQKCFINVQDGSLRDVCEFQGQIHTWQKQYSCVMTFEHALGDVTWLITGDLNGNQQLLDAPQAWDDALLLDNGIAVLQASSRVGVTLYCYSLSEGTLISSVILPEQYELFTLACPDGDKIWLCDSTGSRFFCWDTSVGSTVESATAFADCLWLEGDAAVDETAYANRLRRIEQEYGVELEVIQGENRTPGVDYSAWPDLRGEQYDQALVELERALRVLPEGFMTQVGQAADSRKVTITLVDNYDPAVGQAPNTGDTDVTGGEIRLYVSICPELKEIFWHELFHALDVQILIETDGMNHWDELNPDEFSYVSTYALYYSGALKDSEYLFWGSNYFADDYAMLSPREDRAQVFVYAIAEGQSHRFTSPAMQEKLALICEMLRQCFDIPKDEVPVWEQYILKD